MGSPGAEACPVGSCDFRAGWKHVANADAAGTEHVPRDGAANRAVGCAGGGSRAGRHRCRFSPSASSSAHPSAQPVAVINAEALSRFSSSSFPGKITDAFNSLARKSNFRAISKKLGLVCPRGAAGLPLCPRAHCCQKSSGQSVPVPGSPGSASPETRTARGQSCCCHSRQRRDFSPGQGVTAGFPVCPDSGPHRHGGGPGAPAVPGLASLPANTPAPLQRRRWLRAAAWRWGSSSVASVLGRWRGPGAAER